MSDGRSYVTGYYGLMLDGFNCGISPKIEGGDMEGVVTEIPRAHDYYKSKQIAQVKYNEFTGQFGISMSQPLQDWIDASLNMQYMRKSGEVQKADFRRQIRQVTEFKDALLSGITLPAGDGAAKEAAFATLKWKPWISRTKKGDLGTVESPVDAKQKEWHCSDFRFNVDGLEKACAKISKFDAVEIKQTFVRDEVGMERDNFDEPSAVTYPNLKVTLSEEFSEPFWQWHQSFVIDGVNTDDVHKTAEIVYLNRTRQKELLTATVSGLGIFKISSAPRENNKDSIATTTVEMYCERIQVKFG